MTEFLDPSEDIQKHGIDLPHWQQSDAMQFVTFRLGDAMPQDKLRQWKEEFAVWTFHHPKPWSPEVEKDYQKRFIWRLERWLDEGSGSCILAEEDVRGHLEGTLMHDHGTRADFHAWVIMPNHVHLLFTARHPLERLMKSWKGVSSHKIGRGSIWQKGYRDTMIRDGEHFANAVRYIRRNPAKLRPGMFTLWQSERALVV
jgi:putative transposase